MSRVDFKLNLRGLNELMKSEEMQTVLTEVGSKVMSNANSLAQDPKAEYSMNTKVINYIAVTNVRAANGEAVHENYENNTLLKSLR